MPTSVGIKTSFYSGLSRQIHAILVETAGIGGKIASERDLSRHFGVSTTTVARVLRDLQNDGLIERVKGKGTFLRGHALTGAGSAALVDLAGSQRKSNDVGTVAIQLEILILANLTPVNDDAPVNDWWDCRVATSSERAIQRQGHTTHIVNIHETADDGVLEEFDDLVSRGLNGVVVIGNVSGPLWRRLIEVSDPGSTNPLPVVHVNWDGPDVLPFDSVGFDGEAGFYLATRYLLDRGHRDIRFLAPGWLDCNNLEYWLRMRLLGFYRALTAAGLSDVMPIDVLKGKIDYAGVEFGDETPEDLVRWRTMGQSLWKRLSAKGLPDAVVTINDQTARAFIEAARADGASIPGDMSVIGFDDRYDSSAFGLTTVHVPLQEIGEAAVSALLEQIQAPRMGNRTHVLLTPTLVVRKTTSQTYRPAREQASNHLGGIR